MTEEPLLDGRTRADVLDQLTEIAPYYVDDWDPDRPDAGTTLLKIFASMSEDVIDRLDRVPEKQRAAFLNALDFSNQPPQPAKLPVTFSLDENATDNVDIPPGTALESAETDEWPAQQFETIGDRPFEATPARITDAFGVDPGTDRLVDHWDSLERGHGTTLFGGENLQEHALYLGDADLLQLAPGAAVELEVRTNAPKAALREYLEWEYFGEDETGEEDWHAMAVGGSEEPDSLTLSESQQVWTFLDRLEAFLSRQGYRLAGDGGPPEVLVRSLADSIRKGRFDPPQTDREGPELPPELFGTTDVRTPIVRKIQHQLTTLQDRFERASVGADFGETVETRSLSFEIPGTTTEREIDGVESRWIRARIPPGELSHALFNVLVESVTISVGATTQSNAADLTLDEAVANDITLELDAEDPLLLLGENPTGEATFMFACREAFTKPGATVTLQFDHAEEQPTAAFDPDLSWEYWNGTGWRRLSVTDETDGLQTSGTVELQVPGDMEVTTEQGTDARWMRVRLVGGDYGQPQMEEIEPQNWERTTDHISPPTYQRITVTYDRTSVPFENIVTRNSTSCTHHSPEAAEFAPFESLPGETQALYLGLDEQLRGGPITLYLPIRGSVFPDSFNPWIDVEYCTEPDSGQWRRVDLRDGTEDFTELGILELTLPEPTESFSLFGRDRHWIRLKVTGDEFTRTDRRAFVETTENGSATSYRELRYQSVAARERGHRTRTPPVLDGLYLNTQWARNVETVTDEILGSSSGTASQTFQFPDDPVLEATVWIDERAAHSEREIDRLRSDPAVTLREESRGADEQAAVWVRWGAVSDFFESGPEDRHYRLDETNGRLVFGDGRAGMIPPEGENNISVSYRTGGGSDGNVPAGMVDSLLDPLPSVDSVTNPAPGETGEDTEPLSELVERAPKQLRDRGKPITRDGFRRIALSASREIERVRCRAGEDEAGSPGKVTILIVPNSDQRKPVPADDLVKHVETEMQERAPAAVMTSDRSEITVRGPQYVEVSVSATVETDGVQSISDVTDEAESSLRRFIHPLTGGPDGTGWEIGTAPPPSVFAVHLEQLEAVERVTTIAVTFTDGQDELTLAGSEDAPRVSPDVLVYSGRHDVTVDI